MRFVREFSNLQFFPLVQKDTFGESYHRLQGANIDYWAFKIDLENSSTGKPRVNEVELSKMESSYFKAITQQLRTLSLYQTKYSLL